MKPKKSRQAPSKKFKTKAFSQSEGDKGTRLNKHLANAGICSRREADELIAMGMVQVNGKVVTEMGFRVQPKDEVRYDGQRILGQKPVYILLNKPKGFVATAQGGAIKKSVQELIQTAAPFKISPMGDMGRPMTGLLFFTNDVKLRSKINESKRGVEMLYKLVLDRNVTPSDMDKLKQPQQVFGQTYQFDRLSFVDGGTKRELGLEVRHIQPSIVVKIFGQYNYKIQQLDRVVWAGLTKKDLTRGRWRHLNETEVNRLRML